MLKKAQHAEQKDAISLVELCESRSGGWDGNVSDCVYRNSIMHCYASIVRVTMQARKTVKVVADKGARMNSDPKCVT